MIKRTIYLLIIIPLIFVLASCNSSEGENDLNIEEDINVQRPETQEWETSTRERVTIHDPAIRSVTNEEGEEVFYVFGTHVSQAKTKDLVNWEVPFTVEYENMEDNLIFGNTVESLAEPFEWAGHDDADSAGGFNLWAPDVIWNPDFEWGDGETGAYMMYYSLSSTWRRSVIVLLVSPDIEGPYEYVDAVVYSGFTSEEATDGSDRNIHFEGTHLPQLIESGKVSEFKDEWVRSGGREYNTDVAPNAIDPAPFYDEKGAFRLVYGSWSGGIFLYELDPTTGLPIYPGEDGETDDGRPIDRYFGTKLSGGYHQSGEGPYIQYDEESGYYYLYLTYGGLAANGGYNMRVFRSESVDGPYVDAKGNTGMIDHRGDANHNYGIKLMGNYRMSGISRRGYRAPGHNSTVVDNEGNWFLVFHTRFDEGTEEHQVRIHQQFKNSEDWPVPLPYEYRGVPSELGNITLDEVVGEYELIQHGTDNSTEMIEPINIAIAEDGTISGETESVINMTEEGYVEITIDEITYNGVITTQPDEFDEERIVFSAVGENNEMIWGVQSLE
jgi:arabinan endo-1,5-alpha-L-arabinosidase